MASGLFALLDDIAVLMDDVAVVTKVATKKTAGILGDDLAVTADKASGFTASRELPVIWAITKGSLLNKVIILPVAFLLSAFLPVLIVPILMLGGIYLAYEGAEKIYEYFFPDKAEKVSRLQTLSYEALMAEENKKIKSAIFTDFILSIEIIMIALGAVSEQPLLIQMITVTFIAFLATIGVYGIVALLVRMDDFGYKLKAINGGKSKIFSSIGTGLILALPKVIKLLTIIGTLAMLLVAGGIYVHNIHILHDILEGIPALLGEFLVGIVVGTFALILMKLFLKIKSYFSSK